MFKPNQKLRKILEKNIKNTLISDQILNNDINNMIIETQKFIKTKKLDGLILGCTELPLIFPKNNFRSTKIIDSLNVLANFVINFLKC